MNKNINSGWMNIETGECGTFDKNNNPRSYTFLEKIKIWWNKPNYNGDEFWEYKGVYDLNITQFNKTYKSMGSVYINNFLQRAYLLDSDGKNWIDYNALTKNNKLVFLS